MSDKIVVDMDFGIYTLEFFNRVSGKEYKRWGQIPRDELIMVMKCLILALDGMFPDNEFNVIIGEKYGKRTDAPN